LLNKWTQPIAPSAEKDPCRSSALWRFPPITTLHTLDRGHSHIYVTSSYTLTFPSVAIYSHVGVLFHQSIDSRASLRVTYGDHTNRTLRFLSLLFSQTLNQLLLPIFYYFWLLFSFWEEFLQAILSYFTGIWSYSS
jgi:hypothetical protein